MSVHETILTAPPERWRTAMRRLELVEVFTLPESPLRRRVARAAAWMFGIRFLETTLAIIRTLVVAPFLLPKDFGLFAVILMTAGALELININGLRAALIQKHDDSRRDLDTVWSVLLFQNCLNAAILVALADPVAHFFGVPRAADLIRAFSITFLLDALANVGSIHFEKRMLFHKEFAFMLSGTLVDLGLAMTLAAVLHSAWALVGGAVAGRAARLLASYMLQEFRPRLRFKWLNFRQLFRFDFAAWISGALWFFLLQGDRIFVGKTLGLAALGIYVVAGTLSFAGNTDISTCLQRFMFPSSASTEDDPAHIRTAYLKLLRATALCILPTSIVVAALAPEIVAMLLGPTWASTVPVLSTLALLGALYVFLSNAGSVLRNLGEVRQAIIGETILLIIAGALIVPLSLRLDLVGVAYAMAAGAAAAWMWSEYCVLKELKISLRELLRAFDSSVAAALVMLATIYLLRGLFHQPTWASLLSMSSAAALMYLFTIAVAALSRNRMKASAAAV